MRVLSPTKERPMARHFHDIQNGSCLLKIQGLRDSVKMAEKRLAEYILDNPEHVTTLTMEQLADSSASSYATIYRFVKKLGYPGFKEFKSSLIHNVAKNDATGDGGDKDILSFFELGRKTSIPDICSTAQSFFVQTIRECISIVDPAVFEEAVDMLLAADKIFFIGTGTSYISSLYAHSKFMRIGLNCSHEAEMIFGRLQASLLNENDVLFAISSSGRSQAVVETARVAKNNGAKVIGLSDFAISPLTKLSTLNLHTTPRSVAESSMAMDFPLIVGQIVILDILYLRCSAKLGDPAREAYIKTKIEAEREKK